MSKSDNGAVPKIWGITSAEFLGVLRGRDVQIITLDGKAYNGVLMGVDTYDVIIRQTNGNMVLIAKHAVKLITAA